MIIYTNDTSGSQHVSKQQCAKNYFVTVPDTFHFLLEQRFLFCHSIKTITAVSDGVHEVHALKVQMEILAVIRFQHLISEIDSNKLLPILINHF